VWQYRRTLFRSTRNLVMRGIVPLLGGLTLAVTFVYGLVQFAQPDWLQGDNGKDVTILGIGAVAVVGVGAIVIGAVLMVIWWLRAPEFFAGETLNRTTPILVLELERAGVVAAGEPTLIAPDYSNLPTGHIAVDETTGVRRKRTRSRRRDSR
jgi:hypothetical protein